MRLIPFLLLIGAVNCESNSSIQHSSFDSSTCGIEKACFLPTNANCYMGCNGMGFSYVFTDNTYNFMKIEIFGKVTSNTGFYYAVGFSLDIMMGGDHVIECSSLGNAATSLKFSYNVDNFNGTNEPSNIRIPNQDNYAGYFLNSTITTNDGMIYCSATVKVSGAADSEVFKFNKTQPNYYLLMANGPTNNAGLLHHVHDVTTPLSVNLLDVHPAFDPNGCGVTKGCYIPTHDDCNIQPLDMVVSYYMLNETHLQLEILGTAPSGSGSYIAVGFSLDNKMGDESVIECSQYGTNPLSTKFSYNNGVPANVRIENETIIRPNYIKDQSAYQDGKLYCTATILVDGSSGNSQIFKYDKNQAYYLLLAKGNTSTTGLTQHTTTCVPKLPVKLSQLEQNFDATTCNTATKTCFLPTECYMGCNGMGFSFKMIDASTMKIEMFSVGTSLGYYVAVGFSTDNQMGDESVIECSSINNDNYSVKFSYNIGGDNRYNTRITEEPNIRSQYITNEVVSFKDGSLYCSATVKVSGYTDNPQIFTYDPNKNYYLLMASGTTSATGLTKHFDHVVSDSPYDLVAGTNVSSTAASFDCSACGQTKGCYFPDDAFTCNGYGVSYRYISDSILEMELTKKGIDGYVAVGFSDDNMMGNDYVIECSNLGKAELSWKFSYNNDSPTNIRITNETQIEGTYFSDVNVTVANGEIYCYAKVNVAGWAGSGQVFKYSPGMQYFLLMAQGPTTGQGLSPHTDKMASYLSYDLKQVTGIPPSPNTAFNCSQCGQTKTCFFPKNQNSCGGMGVAIQYLNATTMSIELMKSGTGGYVTVGFNPSAAQMANSYVIECSQMSSQNSPTFKFSYNNPTNVRITNEAQIEGTYFSDQIITSENGATYCKSTVNVGGWSGSNQVFKFDPSQEYYLMIAIGATSGSVLAKHSDREVGNSKVNLTIAGSVSSKGGLSPIVIARLIKAHAVMMILAWICFVPTALLFARFLRTSWPLIKPGGLLIWFHVHRTCNFLGIALTIASFVCVMTANSWKWSGPPHGEKWASVHTMCGLFALIFAWAQPFISFMRCQPNTPNRPLFNWTHRIVGVVAYVLATTALSVAAFKFNLGSSWTNSNLQLGLVLCPISLMAFLVVLFLILDYYQDKEHNHGSVEMIRQVVVLVSVGLIVGDAVALSIMVCV